MANYKEYAKRIVDAIKRYGETVYVKTRTSDYDIIEGETYTYKRYKNFKCFFRNTDKSDWEQLPEGLRQKEIRKIYYTEKFPDEELIIERLNDGKEYEIVIPPDDNYFDGINFYYKCYVALKEEQKNVEK